MAVTAANAYNRNQYISKAKQRAPSYSRALHLPEMSSTGLMPVGRIQEQREREKETYRETDRQRGSKSQGDRNQ